ncbi:MAG TPA: sulfotransferase [Rhodanobacteraceae bacterium]|nr:sulfotransferase [Rhodanobacteraceae bacterium]
MFDSASQAGQLWSQAQVHLAAKQAAPARAALEALLAVEPDHTLARLALSNLAWRQNRVREAAEHALHAGRSVPDYPDLICEIAGALLRVGETVAARECLQRPVLKSVSSDTLLIRLADHWHALGEHAEALAQADRARELGFDGDGVRHRRGRELVCLGRVDEAEPELELGFLLGPTHGEIALELSRLRVQSRERNHFNTLAGGIKNVARGSRDHAALEFALYKELEDVGRYDDAWQALTRANAIMAQRKRCDVPRMQRWFELCIALCTRETLRSARTNVDGPQPIFVVGLPHSGTRELAGCLGRHLNAVNAGELNDFEQQLRWAADHRNTQDEQFLERVPTLDFEELGRRYHAQTQWHARGKPYYIDCQPDNWMYAGLIHAALPHARILHVTADPMDACFAQYRAFFGDTHEYTYDLAGLAAHERCYRRSMTHWHALMPGVIFDVSCESFLSARSSVLRDLLAHCGGTETTNDAQETVSNESAACETQPASRGGWRRYAAQLASIAETLAQSRRENRAA